ncbi:MAG TPA: ATP-binding protein [Candidatus Binatia bacterium]|nr:ATP-binding protein [Candidatus Binatia bacterium]
MESESVSRERHSTLMQIAPRPAPLAPEDVARRVLAGMSRAMGRFAMLRPGDRVAVGVSGGKDSLCLLHALVTLRRRLPFSCELVAVTLEQGKFKAPIGRLERQVRDLGVDWVLREDQPTLRLVARGVDHGCDVCSRHRRSALYRLASELGCSVLALGHTADDCAESLLRGILFNGRIAPLPPVARSRKGGMRVIRPLVLVGEDLTEAYTASHGLEVVKCVCSDKDGVRRELRDMLAVLRQRHPGVPASIAAALGAVHAAVPSGRGTPGAGSAPA